MGNIQCKGGLPTIHLRNKTKPRDGDPPLCENSSNDVLSEFLQYQEKTQHEGDYDEVRAKVWVDLARRLKDIKAQLDQLAIICRLSLPEWSLEWPHEHQQFLQNLDTFNSTVDQIVKTISQMHPAADSTELNTAVTQIEAWLAGYDNLPHGIPNSTTTTAQRLESTLREREEMAQFSREMSGRKNQLDWIRCHLPIHPSSVAQLHYDEIVHKVVRKKPHNHFNRVQRLRARLHHPASGTLEMEMPVPSDISPWIDVPLMQRWISHCDSHHGKHCSSRRQDAHIFSHQPSYLVDAHRQCLTVYEHGMQYVALSYVWGSLGSYKTLQRDLISLTKYEALLESRVRGPLPQTIKDAIQLTKRIGQRYIWIDALCIVQDDEEGKQEHLRSMGSIYANAYVTIVAAGGTAHDGLRGFSGITPSIQRRRHEMGRNQTVKHLVEAHRDYMRDTLWNKRGWTFQEQIFSRRIIVLGKYEASWECHCSLWFEGHEPYGGVCHDERKFVTRGFDFETKPNIHDYMRHVAQYNRRELTFPEDVLKAFTGITNTLNSFYSGGFVAGLPACLFNVALLWRNKTGLIRRKSTGKTSMPPSWSWAAWQGSIDDKIEDCGHRSILVKWIYKPTDDANCQLIEAEGHIGQKPDIAAAEYSLETLRHPVPDLLYARPLHCIMPVKNISRTKNDFLSIELPGGHVTPCEKLVGNPPLEVELVAISQRDSITGLMYDVLWIEWKDGIGYRKGVGEVSKETWKLHSRWQDRIDLVLG